VLLNWLIKLLGGFTVAELTDRVIEARGDYKEERIHYEDLMREEREKKDAEVQRLSNLIFKEHGVIQPEQEKRDPTEFKPMHKRMSWRERQKELQQKDAREQADRVQAQWEKKNAG